MRRSRRRTLTLFLIPLAGLLAAGAVGLAQPTPTPANTQQTTLKAHGASVPIDVREQYLGRSGTKTVVRFILSVSRSDLRHGGAIQPRVYSFFIAGGVKGTAGEEVESFRVPVDIDLSDPSAGGPVQAVFMRSLPPGSLSVQFRLEGITGEAVGMRAVDLTVPKMESEFRAEDAGTNAQGLPSAAAVILESENRPPLPAGGSGLVKIVPPSREVPVGLLRIECQVSPPVTRVEFYLDEKKLLTRNRPPYTAELDLGRVPRKQTLKVLGYDSQGNLVDSDAWAINEREARLAVSILELPTKTAAGPVELKVAVHSIAGGAVKSLRLYVDDTLVKEWASPPYVAEVDADRLRRATLLRATALDEEGKEYSDVKLLKGESRFISRVEVNLVELHVSVFDEAGRFRKGLHKEDFTVLEDGLPQEVSGFDFAESLPITLGVVIDGSGSMRDAMPLVHQAAGDFVHKLISTEKDRGFVIEFRESPTLLASLTNRTLDLERAIAETHAQGETALWDSIVMALYQFRAIPGRKAIVVLTDGDDNHSWTEYPTLRRYARTTGIPIYFIGLNLSILDMGIRSRLTELAADTGAEAFYVSKAVGLPDIYRKIETELRSQYFVSYLTNSKKGPDEFRSVEVKLKDPKLKAKTIRGYFP